MYALDRYILGVLVDRWAAPARAPFLLDVSRRADGIAGELTRAGFRVTRITLEDSSLETVSERLAGLRRSFDAVVCRDVLELVDDWQEVVGRAARRLRPGGVFVYGVGRVPRRRWVGRFAPRWLGQRGRPPASAGEMAATLRRHGLSPRELVPVGAAPSEAGSTVYMGHSIMRADRPARAPGMRWNFIRTGEHGIADLLGAQPGPRPPD
jgi:SAM-dependent methyltransferase